jgi:cardiolipin synthase
VSDARLLAGQAFSRAAGAPLVHGNAITLLRDARENYPRWLQAIQGAQSSIHFESYIIHQDEVGLRFADALVERARAGVKVRVVYDWMGAIGQSWPSFWRKLRRGGVDVRCFNPPRLWEPLGWLLRDHRKCLVVDGRVAFVTGLCVGKMWEGWPERGLPGWRDTGVELSGPAVADVARAFADTWAACGEPLPASDLPSAGEIKEEGDVSLRVVATTTGTTALYRLDTLVAALARKSLWLTDAYFAGSSTYVQALRSAAADGVDVRLLVPGRGSDIAVMQAVSRAGYRALLEGGVRVFEWNGPMVHAKTAVADGRWARVGSTNLNVASWIGNWELDVVVEDERFGREMEEQYVRDLAESTEVVLSRRRVREAEGAPRRARTPGGRGSASRAAAGALRIGNAIGAALSPRRVHGAAERRLLVPGGIALVALAPVAFLWPEVLAFPLGTFSLWLGAALLVRAVRGKPIFPSPKVVAAAAQAAQAARVAAEEKPKVRAS